MICGEISYIDQSCCYICIYRIFHITLETIQHPNKHENILYEKLISDPEEFISSLMRNNQNKEMLI